MEVYYRLELFVVKRYLVSQSNIVFYIDTLRALVFTFKVHIEEWSVLNER